MPRTNKITPNTVGGELSPKMYGRVDLPVYQKGLATCQNFVILPQGGAQFRTGTMYVKYTRLNKKAVLIPFQFSDAQSYLIEATEFKFRFYKDNGVITETAKTITAATAANPCEITSAAHGFSNGDEVYISGIVGMTQLNGKFFLVTGATANTFTLTDVFGTAINSTAYTAYVSGGTAARVYEIATIYHEADLEGLKYAQSADTMYVVHQNYEPRKITRTGHAAWSQATYVRTADPFTPVTTGITAATQANPGVITAAAHGLATGDVIRITAVGGMVELNNLNYSVVVLSANTFSLKDPNGVVINTTAYTAYTAGGTVTNCDEWPGAVAFSDTGRLMFGGTKDNPETIWGSKAPTTGTTAFDNFTTGSGATDAFIFTLAPIHGKVDAIRWMANTSKAIVVGTFGAVRRLYGATEQEAISPTSVTAKSVNNLGVANIIPVQGDNVYYMQRDTKTLRSIDFDISVDGYTTTDRNLVADHLTSAGVKQITEQQGNPDIIWAVLTDGKVAGLTFKQKEEISGWHRMLLGGSHVNSNSITRTFGKVLWVGAMPRPLLPDQLWLVVERYINGQTTRSVEYVTDPPIYPIRTDFYTGVKATDDTAFKNAEYEMQKDAIHMDMAVSFDGSAAGSAASATMTPGANSTVQGTTLVTFTASAAVFDSTMVNREIWKKYDVNGNGGGRAKITAYTDTTHVVCTILSAFDNLVAVPAGSWFLTSNSISGLDHLEGLTVKVLADGGPHTDEVVTGGAITLDAQSSKVHVGLFQRGILRSLNLDQGGASGSAESKRRNLIKVAVRFINSLGVNFGSSIYKLQRIVFRKTTDQWNRPTPLFNGIREERYGDSWIGEDLDRNEKSITVVQDYPLPMTILSLDTFMDTSDE